MKKEYRPWGYYEVLLDEPNYKVKRITINPKCRLSKQSHELRDEYWVVVDGYGIVTRDNDRIYCSIGYDINIPKNTIHRAENIEENDFVFIETQIGKCIENDVVRLEDDYNRI